MVHSGVSAMAKKKSRPRIGPGEERATVIVLKGTPEYATWLDNIYWKTHIPKATIVRLALMDWAKKNGHQAPPDY
jgi:hypothetical protein